MSRLRRLIGGVLLVALATAAVAVTTGWLAVATTHGVSMRPSHAAGDLVVVADTGGYEIGDVVAYRDQGSGDLVLHRIVGGDADGFVLRGDNNRSDDPDRPTASAIIGREVLHVPAVGHVLGLPGALGVLGVVVGLIGVALVAVPRRRRDGVEPPAAGREPPRPARRRSRRRVALIATLVVVDVAAGGALAAAFVFGPQRDEPASVPDDVATLAYRAAAPGADDTYAGGEVRTGDALFLRLVDRIDVRGTYAPGTADAARVELRAVVSAASGWRTTVQVAPPTDAGADPVELAGTLDVADLTAKVSRVARRTGVEPGPTQVRLELVASGPTGDPVVAAVDFDVTALSWAPDDVVVTPGDDPVVRTVAASIDSPPVPDEHGGIPRSWRRPLLLALAGVLVLTALCWPAREPDVAATPAGVPPRRVRVTRVVVPGTLPRLRLADRDELDAMAQRWAEPVLERDGGWCAVVAPHVVYWYEPPADTVVDAMITSEVASEVAPAWPAPVELRSASRRRRPMRHRHPTGRRT